ncbi:GGDEF domain-containing protein [Planctomycetota bacterium]
MRLSHKISRATLAFSDADAERSFLETFLNKDTHSVRQGILLGLALAGVAAALRYSVAKPGAELATTMPLISACVLLAVVFVLSYSTFFFQRYMQQVVALLAIVVGFLVGLLPLIKKVAGAFSGEVPLLLVLIGGYTLLNLRFLYATAVGLGLTLAHLACLLTLGEGAGIDLWSTVLVLAAGNTVGMLASYNLELSKRHIFLQTLSISRKRMEVKRLNVELNEMAIRDPLTKLFNRRYLDTRLSEAIDVFGRYDTVASILLIDLDNFKQVNDQLGHNAGDDLLVGVAEVLSDHFRDTDLVFRYGGDEFVVLMPSTVLEDASRVAHRLLTQLNTLRTREFEGKTVQVGFSAGVCALYKKSEPMDAVLHRADSALYEAKAAGKGRIVTAAA